MGNKDTFSPIEKERVVSLLKGMGCTQKKMCEELDITAEHLSRCLKRGSISKTWLIAIAEFLDTTTAYLSGQDDTQFYYWAEKRLDFNGDELLNNYIQWLGWSPNEMKALTEADYSQMRYAIKMIIDGTIAEANKRKDE